MKKKYKVGSLFAGVGGICLGFMQAENPEAEYEVVWANEIDEYASETYRTNFKHNLIEGDIELVLKPELVQVRIDHIKAQLKSIDDISKIKLELNNLVAEINNSTKLYEEMTASFTDLSKDICEKSEQLKSISKFENHVEEVLQINSKIESVTDKGQLLKLISDMIKLADKLTSKTEKKDIERLLAKYQDQLSAKYKNKDYADSNLYKQAGNAVSVPVIRFLAEELLKVLASNENIDESDIEKKTDAVIS